MSALYFIQSEDFYSNCLLEAVKVKLKDWSHVTITYVSPFDNEVFCPHFLWSDGKFDYDFGYEDVQCPLILAWTIHKGHIRQRTLGFNQKYKNTCKKWNERKGRWQLWSLMQYIRRQV